jgi:hypothetical protein
MRHADHRLVNGTLPSMNKPATHLVTTPMSTTNSKLHPLLSHSPSDYTHEHDGGETQLSTVRA